jgi:molybdopterin synthase catalytic subunit
MIRIQREPIDAAALLTGTGNEHTGALALFLGVVRADTLDGRRVVALEYEAFAGMAEHKMAEIEEQVRRRWSIEGLAMVHRVGRLTIGEASVAVAVATGHRGQSFEACRYAIDTIKAIVPIWKKEIFADGESRWVLPPQAEAGAVEPSAAT